MRIRNLQISFVCMVCIACSQPKIEQRYIPLDLGQVKAEGWLKDWAQDAANGITAVSYTHLTLPTICSV